MYILTLKERGSIVFKKKSDKIPVKEFVTFIRNKYLSGDR